MFTVYQAELALKAALLGVMNAYASEGVEFSSVTATVELTSNDNDVAYLVQAAQGEIVTREASH